MRIPAAVIVLSLMAVLWLVPAERQPDRPTPDQDVALGHTYLQKARETGDPSYYSRAAKLFDRALSQNSDHVEALIGKASLAMSRHDFETARQDAARAAQLDRYSAGARGLLADALIELRRPADAIKALDEMVRLKPNLSSYSRISYMRQLKGDTTGAIEAMEMAIQAGAPNAENTAWCIVQLGHIYLADSKWAEASAAYQAALKRFPNYVHAYAGLAKVAVARKEFEVAAAYYEKAVERIPLPEVLIALGDVYRQLGKDTQARAQYDLVEKIRRSYEENGVSSVPRTTGP